MQIDILSLFPDYFESPFSQSMVKRAKEAGLIRVNAHDIRSYAEGHHNQVDDRPYGGGPGMVLMAPPVVRALREVKKEGSHVVYLTPQGTPLTAAKCEELAQHQHLILLCGHYEGIDERALKEVDEEISIGDYVLTSGCPAAIVLVDAVVRFRPGVIGHEEATREDSFSPETEGLFDCPHYTRPIDFEGEKVPEVLTSGDHAKIKQWRKKQGRKKTEKVRPELINLSLGEEK